MTRATSRPHGQSSLQRGYTVVELMMALAIFAVGITGVFAMQTVAAKANAHARNISVATALARSWQESLAIDALLWGGPQNWALTQTRWITEVTTQDNTWFRPQSNTTATFSAAADTRGQSVDPTSATDVVFCTHIRLTKLIDRAGSGLVRSEVRVFWPKGPVAWSSGDPYCEADAADVASIGASPDNFHFVYKTTAIRQTPSF